jgi:hypothetical protein
LNVGHSLGVARDAGLGGNGRGQLARGLRQRTPGVPVDRRQDSYQQNGYAQIYGSQQPVSALVLWAALRPRMVVVRGIVRCIGRAHRLGAVVRGVR